MIRPRGVLAVCLRNARVLRRMFWTMLAGHVGEPFFYLFVFGYGLGRYIPEIEGVRYLDWLLPGIAIASAATSACLECTYSAFTRMERQKTYLAIAATPVSIEEVVVGEALWGATLGLGNAFLTIAAGAAFGIWPGIGSTAAVLGLSFLAALLSSSAALLFTSRARGYEDFAFFFTFLLTPSIILSGAYFPLSAFAPGIARLAELLPLTQALLAARAGGAASLLHTAFLALYLVPFLALAVRGISRRVIP